MPKLKKKLWGGFFPEYELRRRETGFNCNIGWEGKLKHKIYSSLHPSSSWDPLSSCPRTLSEIGAHHGGIFNLEFSPDGKQLVAACEKKAIMIFDPLTRKQISDVREAHASCVNGIKFLDSRLFASCSDDKTVALWDVRNLRRQIKSLSGHDNWVKNIEYASQEGLLVTSGFDGRILGWNLNSYTDESNESIELFRMQGLMRIKLTPDESKLLICSTGGYILMIHDLSLADLSEDLNGFKPYVYRLMQMSNSPVAHHFESGNYFKRKRNRIEFISDFPDGNYAEVIHSLQVHPQAWCVLSRNTSSGDSSEWTCVHDIQELDEDNDNEVDDSKQVARCVGRDKTVTPPPTIPNGTPDLQVSLSVNPRLEVLLRGGRSTGDSPSSSANSPREPEFDQLRLYLSAPIESMGSVRTLELRRIDEAGNEVNVSHFGGAILSHVPGTMIRANNGAVSSSYHDFRVRQRRRRGHDRWSSERRRESSRDVFYIRPELNLNHESVIVLNPFQELGIPKELYKDHVLVKNAPRLTNYIEEPNKGKGFIKELCFSSDGRLICSPFDCGVRLMMFDEHCSELSHCVKKTPQTLCVVSSSTCHVNCVVSTKFSPVDCLLVSGCLNGKIVWHQPII